MSHFRSYQPFARYIGPQKYYSPSFSREPKLYKKLDPYLFAKPHIDDKLTKPFVTDKQDDLTEKDFIHEAENMRPQMEKDYYQDHTYHNQWIQRELDRDQQKELMKLYPHFAPNYSIYPWIWFPGDVVEVIHGPFKGQRGTIISVLAYKNEVTVQNVNVKDITLPATEDTPAQDMAKEHPISVRHVKHVDPETNELTKLQIITVRNTETDTMEKKRICMSSGAILSFPVHEENSGDPLTDTSIQAAHEKTYSEEEHQRWG